MACGMAFHARKRSLGRTPQMQLAYREGKELKLKDKEHFRREEVPSEEDKLTKKKEIA